MSSKKTLEEKVVEHNKIVTVAFKKARKGEVINLTDLMISREQLILDQIKNEEKNQQGKVCESEEESLTGRLRTKGVNALTDSELVSLLLARSEPSFARQLLAQSGGLRGLFSKGWNELWNIEELRGADIAVLLSAVEIFRRYLREEMMSKNVLREPKSVLEYLTGTLRDEKKEIFKVLFLNKANQIIADEDLFTGTVDETAVHPREVLKAALDHHATGIILVHNHPSGRTVPSREDQEITRRLQSVTNSLGIKILDHIIVGDNQHFSFAEQNLL